MKVPPRSFVFGGTVGKSIILTGKAGGTSLPLFSARHQERQGQDCRLRPAGDRDRRLADRPGRDGAQWCVRFPPVQRWAVNLKATGATKLVPSAAALSALTTAGVTPSAVGPATLGAGGFRFPVTGGRLSLDPFGGKIRHSGGIKLSKHSTSAELTDFIIGLDKSPDLTAKTPAGRASIGKLDLSAAKLKVQPGKRKIGATGIKVKLTSAAASLLNGAFGTSFGPAICSARRRLRSWPSSTEHP